MATLQFLHAFISERLTAAAVEIIAAVEKTLVEFQGEISRSKEEVEHLRTLVLWPEVTLLRAVPHQAIPPTCDEVSSEQDHCEEELCTNGGRQPKALHTKNEHDPRTGQGGLSLRQKFDTILSPPFVKKECHQESPPPPLHFYRILTVEHSSINAKEDIKTEPDDVDGFIPSPSTREAEAPCGINPEGSEVQQETAQGTVKIPHHVEDRPLEQRSSEPDWSPGRDREDPDPPQIEDEKLGSSGPEEESGNDCGVSLRPENGAYDRLRSSCPSRDQRLRRRPRYASEEMTRDADGEKSPTVSGPVGDFQPIVSVDSRCPAAHGEYRENANGVEKRVQRYAQQKDQGPRTKERQTFNLHTEGRESARVEANANDPARERRHTCPVCRKRFKESSHLKDHVRIHTGEKPFQCKECGMNFRQSGALTLHARTHTGERPYQCSDCGRRFNRKGDMKTHRVMHTGERPHQCEACGKSFRRKSNLNSHLKTHAKEKMDHPEPL